MTECAKKRMKSRFTFEFRAFMFEIKQTTRSMWLNAKKRT
ncbi:hypothetical protein CSC35_3509 [Enterobacter hormaechei]|nr:hypothetical protein CSC35_3509 [Enterobacter hormaechei]